MTAILHTATVDILPSAGDLKPRKRFLFQLLKPWLLALRISGFLYCPVSSRNSAHHTSTHANILFLVFGSIHGAAAAGTLLGRIYRRVDTGLRTTAAEIPTLTYEAMFSLEPLLALLFMVRHSGTTMRSILHLDKHFESLVRKKEKLVLGFIMVTWSLVPVISTFFAVYQGWFEEPNVQRFYETYRRVFGRHLSFGGSRYLIVAQLVTGDVGLCMTITIRGIFILAALEAAFCFLSLTKAMENNFHERTMVGFMDCIKQHAKLSRIVEELHRGCSALNFIFYANFVLLVVSTVNKFDNVDLAQTLATLVGALMPLGILAAQTMAFVYMHERGTTAGKALQRAIEDDGMANRLLYAHLNRVRTDPPIFTLIGLPINRQFIFTLVGALVSYALVFSELGEKKKPFMLDTAPVREQFREEMESLRANFTIKVRCNFLRD